MPVLEQPDVLQQFSRGDVEAFEALFRMHQGEVYRWILRIVRDAAASEDLTVETFWRIHRSHARFDPARSFGAWARRIATHAALDYLKSAKPQHEMLEDLAQPAGPDPGVSCDVREKTARAFGRLPAKLRIAATLALIEEQPYEEIAEALGTSTGAVKVRVFRAVRLLRQDLRKQGIEP